MNRRGYIVCLEYASMHDVRESAYKAQRSETKTDNLFYTRRKQRQRQKHTESETETNENSGRQRIKWHICK